MMRWLDARRILCVRLDNMGDVLMSTPAMQALKEGVPGRHLTLLTSEGAAALKPHLPMVDALWAWNAPWVKHAQEDDAMTMAAMSGQWLQRVAAGNFDAVAIFSVYSQSPLAAATLCMLAGIPLRLAHCRENPYALLTHWVPETEPHQHVRHEVQRQLDLVSTVGAGVVDSRMRFEVLEADRESLRWKLAALMSGMHRDIHGSPCVVLHPGATAESRRWPADRFAAVARRLAEDGALVLVTGSAAETGIVHSVCTMAFHPGVFCTAGTLMLGEMGALIEHAALLVSNNSGPVHMASAIGTPVVDLYALTNPQHTPWQVPHRTLFADVPCRYCYKSQCPEMHHRCLRDVDVDAVLQAVHQLLDEDWNARTGMRDPADAGHGLDMGLPPLALPSHALPLPGRLQPGQSRVHWSPAPVPGEELARTARTQLRG